MERKEYFIENYGKFSKLPINQKFKHLNKVFVEIATGDKTDYDFKTASLVFMLVATEFLASITEEK